MISFLIPFRTDHSYRETAFQFVYGELTSSWPNAEVVVADSGEGEFNRSAARNRAAAMASGEIFVFVDADSVVEKCLVQSAIKQLEEGPAFPYNRYFAMTEAGSQKFMTTNECLVREDYEYVFPSVETPTPSVGGCLVLSRQQFELAGGYDERFIGWSFEDRAFALALETLAGPVARIPGPLFHLWHPAPETERFGQPYMEHNRTLYAEYEQLAGNRQTMQRLVTERQSV